MKFLEPLANAENFPKPNVLVLPTSRLNVRGLNQRTERVLPKGVVSLGLVDHARTGLFVIAETITSSCIWLPSYHCPALVEPFLAAGKQVKFYPVNASLVPDFDFLIEQLQVNDALVGIRYFGFDCEMESLAVICTKQQVLLIEDLAHAAFFSKLYGDIAVTSLVKFYPISQGGELLVVENSNLLLPLKKALEALPNNFFAMFKQLTNKISRKLFASQSSHYRYFIEEKMSKGIAKCDSVSIHSIVQANIIKARQENYRYLAKHLVNSSWGHPLIPELDDHVTPYVVPFLLNSVAGFKYIRQQGIQIYRWEEMVSTASAISNKYRSVLIQLPCHQGLTKQELDYIVAILMENKNG